MYNTILVPLDGSKRAEAILPHAEALAQCHGAKVVFLEVVESPPLAGGSEIAFFENFQEELEQRTKQAGIYLAALKGEFREKGIEARMCVAHGPIVEAIIDAAERENADLIAIASHGRSGVSRVFYGSVAAGILQRADRPLLIIRSG